MFFYNLLLNDEFKNLMSASCYFFEQDWLKIIQIKYCFQSSINFGSNKKWHLISYVNVLKTEKQFLYPII